jgi:hypothetical protein
LQGSTSGTAVYIESHTVTTNENGLASIEIGGGTIISGSFTSIDWATGSYFIKTETDVTGSTNYTIVATSQLLSVPYALHAKTAESLTGSSTGGHYVGELYGGGIVFYVDHTGEHGLIISINDINIGIGSVWSNIDSIAIGGLSIWDGETNTNAIVTQANHTTSAAQLCLDYSNDGYDDWYLPAALELKYFWDNMYVVQKTIDLNEGTICTFYEGVTYWTSSEFVDSYDNKGFGISFTMPSQSMGEYYKYNKRKVRAIRKF